METSHRLLKEASVSPIALCRKLPGTSGVGSSLFSVVEHQPEETPPRELCLRDHHHFDGTFQNPQRLG